MLYRTPSIVPCVLAAALLGLGACAPASRALPSLPAPEPVVVEPEELGEGPDVVDEEVVAAAPDLLGSVGYDLPLEANSWVEAELNFLVGERASVIGRWLDRGGFYEPFIKSVLADYGLPTDLYHLAMIESGFIPSARSRAGAVGLWQFMPATARMEGLRVDNVVDERLDPIRATHAAAKHLRTLHRSFGGDWALAAASYNAGAGRISRGMQGFGATNFWDLALWGDLAEETKHYVPRLYAMTIIGRDPERFGFAPARPAEPLAFDSIRVDLATPLAELAEIGGVGVDLLARMNPHLLQRITPPGTYTVWVPAGTGPAVQQAFLDSNFRRDGGFATYVVRRGDNLSMLAQRSGLSSARIRELNPRTDWNRLPIGHRLKLPAPAARALTERASAPAETRVAASPPAAPSARAAASAPASTPGSARASSNGASGLVVEHTVASGETLWGIARRYGVAVDEIKAANRLNGATIVAGRKLKIPGGGAGSESNGAQAEPKLAQHVVRAGDTLWSIAREYGSSIDAIQNANRIGSGVIVPGQRLVIPR